MFWTEQRENTVFGMFVHNGIVCVDDLCISVVSFSCMCFLAFLDVAYLASEDIVYDYIPIGRTCVDVFLCRGFPR